jgi:Fic family protein
MIGIEMRRVGGPYGSSNGERYTFEFKLDRPMTLEDFLDLIVLSSNDDYRKWIPEGLSDKFTASEFAKAAKIRRNRAYAVLKVFEKRGIIQKLDKIGRSYVYSIV